MQLSKHFTLAEMTVSVEGTRKGWTNVPGQKQIGALRALCAFVLEPLRAAVGEPITILSGYRSPAINSLVGGAANSEHLEGKACDIVVPGLTPFEVCRLVEEMNLPCRQIIQEFGVWTHLSISTDPLKKPELLTAVFEDGKRKYLPGLMA